MFTGLVACIARLVHREVAGTNLRLTFESVISSALGVNQSVTHNGVCLSVVAQGSDKHTVTAVMQTLHCTNIGNLQLGDRVNVEQALAVTGRFEGHYVQGHVDTCLRCLAREERAGSWCFTFGLQAIHRVHVVEKGAICLNGVSLTVHDVTTDTLSVSIIPYTYQHTTFSFVEVGDMVNVEFDMVGKYVQRLLGTRPVA